MKYLTIPVTILGKWTWDGREKEFLENGVFIGGNGKPQGTWLTVDKKAQKYQVSWFDEKGRSSGFVDSIRLSSDGSTLFGESNKGHTFIATRILDKGSKANPSETGFTEQTITKP